jgi:hypothetical protein
MSLSLRIFLLLAVWLLLAASWAWLCEPLLAWAMPGLHSIEHWLILLLAGELLLSLAGVLVLWYFLRRR